MKTTVIYHSSDFDGLFCREIAKHFLGTKDVECIGWDYGDPKISFPFEGPVYILDLSPECLGGDTYDSSRIIWIDHHKTSIDKFPATIAGYRVDGVAACRLAWQWFANPEGNHQLPNLHAYKERLVSEPYSVQLAGEYDVWDKRNPDAEVFQLGLRSRKLLDSEWKLLLDDSRLFTDSLLRDGEMLQGFVNRQAAEIANRACFLVEFCGLKFLAINSPSKGSLQFAAKDLQETGHDALMKFSYNGSIWDISLYHARHRVDIDLSAIAAKFGGGGHRGACGFRLKGALPFCL